MKQPEATELFSLYSYQIHTDSTNQPREPPRSTQEARRRKGVYLDSTVEVKEGEEEEEAAGAQRRHAASDD